MAVWSANHRACVTTWSTLFALTQLTEPFATAGDLPMSALTFFNAAGTAEMRELQASTLATQLDNIFRVLRGARYEDGVHHDGAVSAMVDVLTVADKTVAELAEVADAQYRFWGEGDVHLI